MPSANYVIRPDDPRHQKIVTALLQRKRSGLRALHQRQDKWKQAEEQFIAYQPESENDAKRRQARQQQGQPNYTTLVLPYSYATLLAAHTYWSSVFLSRNPIMQFQARHGETEDAVMAVEAIMDYQIMAGRMLPVLYHWLFEPGKYGQGIIGMYWDEEQYTVARMVKQPKSLYGITIPGTEETIRQEVQVPGYMGNRIFNIRPYDFFFDSRVPLKDFQRGEFCGRRITNMSWNEVVTGGLDGSFFNVDVLQKYKKATKSGEMQYGSGTFDWGEFGNQASTQIVMPDTSLDIGSFDIPDLGFVPADEICVDLVPKVWGLENRESPEKWVFTLADEKILIGCRPMGAYHNKYPYFVLEYELDAYALFNRSSLEVMKPLQDALDWLFNTHMYNVRKTLNDQLVVDPSRIIMKDARDPNAGRLIRLKPSAYGTDTKTALTQLQVVDVTQGHLQNMSVVMDFFARTTGVNDNIMGMVNTGGRKSATEVRTSSSFGINRLKTNAEYMSATGWSDWAQVALQMTQQYYTAEQEYRIAGQLMMTGTNKILVGPEAIAGFYDFTPVDGTMPIDRFAQAQLWREFIMGVSKVPQIMQQYDMGGIFAWAAQLGGLKNINRFRIQVQPDAQVAAAAAAGNVTPFRPGGAIPAMPGAPGMVPTRPISGVGTVA